MSDYLGYTYTDVVTGFIGTCVGHVFYLTGCEQLLLIPKVREDGSFVDSAWLDISRCIKLDNERIVIELNNSGFDKPAPKR